MLREVIRALLLLFIFSLSVGHATATSCTGVTPTVDQILESDAVFAGQLLEIDSELRPASCIAVLFAAMFGSEPPTGDCVPCVMRFRVHEQFKGTVSSDVSVDFNGAHACPSLGDLEKSGLDLELLIFASEADDKRLEVEMCWGVVEARAVPDHIAELRKRKATGTLRPVGP
jgi:hypothetical protein